MKLPVRMHAVVGLCALAAGCGGDSADIEDYHDEANMAALFEDAFNQTTQDQADDTGCSGVRVPDQRNFAKLVVLTFDDGPNPETTLRDFAPLHAPALVLTPQQKHRPLVSRMVTNGRRPAPTATWWHTNGTPLAGTRDPPGATAIETRRMPPMALRHRYAACTPQLSLRASY